MQMGFLPGGLGRLLGMGTPPGMKTKPLVRMNEHEEDMARKIERLAKVEKDASLERESTVKLFWATVEHRIQKFDKSMTFDLGKNMILEYIPDEEEENPDPPKPE